MGTVHSLVMLATLGGFLALLLGLLLLLLPLLLTELSRPRDSAWGAVVLLLGLVLVTSAERLTGAPMLAVLCGGLLVGRLGGEVAQGRWRALTEEERRALLSSERWSRSLHQLGAIVASLLQSTAAFVATLAIWLGERRQGRSHGKRWVRTDSDSDAGAGASAEVPMAPSGAEAEDPASPAPGPAPSAGSSGGGDASPAPPSSQVSAPAGERAASAEALDVPSPAGEVLPTAPIPGEEAAGAGPPEQEGDDRAETPPLPDRAAPLAAAPAAEPDPGLRVVADFNAVDALLAAAPEPSEAAIAGSLGPQGSGGEAG